MRKKYLLCVFTVMTVLMALSTASARNSHTVPGEEETISTEDDRENPQSSASSSGASGSSSEALAAERPIINEDILMFDESPIVNEDILMFAEKPIVVEDILMVAERSKVIETVLTDATKNDSPIENTAQPAPRNHSVQTHFDDRYAGECWYFLEAHQPIEPFDATRTAEFVISNQKDNSV